MDNQSIEKFIINPSVSVKRLTDNELFFNFGSRALGTHRISDDHNNGKFADFVESFKAGFIKIKHV